MTRKLNVKVKLQHDRTINI